MDVTDATFEAEVIIRSGQTPVVVDLWAPWCGPCKQLGPILEKVIAETNGKVVLAKVNVDENPGIAQAFQAQSIPAVHAIVDGKPVDSFLGAQGEETVRQFVSKLGAETVEDPIDPRIAAGDEASLRALLNEEVDHLDGVLALAALLIERDEEGDKAEALTLLERVPQNPDVRHLAALARAEAVEDIDSRLNELLMQAKEDDEARQAFIDLLEVLGSDNPKATEWRRKLASALY